MRNEFLPFSPPFIGQDEINEVVETLKSGWITTGSKTKQFETQFCKYLGAPAALALSSCTAALHTALVLAEIGPGDEVITTPMTFAATVAVIEHVGATPVLVDVEPDTLNIDPEQVAQAVTENTKAVLPVHFGGHPCDLDALQAICDEHNLWLIEDAAHALPTTYKGRLVGSGKSLVAFSFYATKNLTTAEGGMLTGPSDLIEKAQVISLHGMDKDAWKRNSAEGSWRYDVTMPGFKYNMTDIQSALGLVQLAKLNDMTRQRQHIAQTYQKKLEALGGFDLPAERVGCQSAWHLYPIRMRKDEWNISRDTFIEEMKNQNIGTSVHFIPIYSFSYYRNKYNFREQDFPVTAAESDRLISLPLHPGLSPQDISDVVVAIGNLRRAYCS